MNYFQLLSLNEIDTEKKLKKLQLEKELTEEAFAKEVDDRVKQAYLRKKNELQADIDLGSKNEASLKSQLDELEKAKQKLNTFPLIQAYHKELAISQSAPAQLKGSNIRYLVTSPDASKKIETAYTDYVSALRKTSNYNTLPPADRKDFDKQYTPHTEVYNSYDDLIKSSYYQSLSEKEKQEFSRETFIRVEITTIKFASQEDAKDFFQKMVDQGYLKPVPKVDDALLSENQNTSSMKHR